MSESTKKKTVAKKAAARPAAKKKPAAKKPVAKKAAAAKKAPVSKKVLKDPQGGLTAAGRKAFKERDGSHLKPGVTAKQADMKPEDMKRKGSFLRRHFANPRGPMLDAKGRPTRLALSAHAWGEAVPKTVEAAKRLAEKGAKLLERYRRFKAK